MRKNEADYNKALFKGGIIGGIIIGIFIESWSLILRKFSNSKKES